MAFKYLMLYIDAHTFFLSPCVQYYSHFTVGNLLHPIDVQIDHVCPEVFNCIDLWPNKDVMWLIKSLIRYYYTQRALNSAKSATCNWGSYLLHPQFFILICNILNFTPFQFHPRGFISIYQYYLFHSWDFILISSSETF